MPFKSHLKFVLILATATTLLPSASLLAGPNDSAEKWPPITSQTRPWARWWWMGSAVDAANLDRELARYQAAGLGGVEVTPIYGVQGWQDREIAYLTPNWMAMLNHAIATGSRLGMETDMATGTGWCFGGPTVSANDANALLVAEIRTVQAGTSLSGTFDPATTQALVAFSADGKCVDLTGRIDTAGHVNWNAEAGPWQVYAISQKPSGQMVKRSAPGGVGPMLNPFFADAVSRYMQWFDKPFALAKPKLRCLFQDSYEYNSNWAPDLFAQFEKLRGYRLQGELPALLGTLGDDHAARVKSDYRESISDIMTLQSMPVWVNWAHAHGYLARYQAHGAPGNLLDLYAVADIPETEIYFQSRDVLVCKFASSAAHVTGKKLASAETGTWLAPHFTETLGEMKQLADDMFLAGINHIIYHGTAYSPDEASWPGWCFYASTEMNPRNSIWRDVPALNAYITRCQSFLQSGTSDNDVLLYWPIYDRWDKAAGMVEGFDISGKWFEPEPIGQTAHHLWDHGYAFDYVSDRQLADPEGPGRDRYKVVVVPPCHLMPVETLQRLMAIAARGGTVIFEDKLPDDVPGWGDLARRRAVFKTLLAGIPFTEHAGEKEAAVGKGRMILGDVDAALNSTGVAPERSIVAHPGLHFVRLSVPNGHCYFIANRGSQPMDGPVALATNKSPVVELMDPMTGRIGKVDGILDRGSAQVRLQLDPGESIIARTIDAPTGDMPAWHYHTSNDPTELTGTWSVKFIEGGPSLPPPFQTDKLDSWTKLGGSEAQSFAGTALYTLTFDAPPGQTGPWTISLGKVCQSARVRVNGEDLGTVVLAPFRVEVKALRPQSNLLEVEVTNVSANRIRDMDIRHVRWKIFEPPNMFSFDASAWPVTDSGLLGPVTLNREEPSVSSDSVR